MCANAMWMCHHWFMHIETHPCLGRSHTRASMIVTMGIIRNTFDVHMALQLFLTPPPKMERSPRDNNFAILAIIVWAGIPMRPWWFLSWKANEYPICQKNEIFVANYMWMNWTPLPKMYFGGANDRSNYPIAVINVWAMQLIELPFPCSNSWNKSRCWEHYVSLSLMEINIEYGVITQPYINLTYVVHHKVVHPMGFLQI